MISLRNSLCSTNAIIQR